MGDISHLTQRHLNACLTTVSSVPAQMRLNVYSSLLKLGSSDRLNNKKICSYCYSRVDLSRADVSLNKVRKKKTSKQLVVKCHFCGKIISDETVDFSNITKKPNDDVDKKPVMTEKRKLEGEDQKPTKKKRVKNAGLIIPASMSKSDPSKVIESTKQVKYQPDKKKLKYLLNKEKGAPRKGGLAEFLNKL